MQRKAAWPEHGDKGLRCGESPGCTALAVGTLAIEILAGSPIYDVLAAVPMSDVCGKVVDGEE